MKIEVKIWNNMSTVYPLDNEEIFSHCVGVDIGSNYLGYCSLEDFENRVKPLLFCHGITELDVLTTTMSERK